jgi:uncharacterized protein YjiS (DUF1127 family)
MTFLSSTSNCSDTSNLLKTIRVIGRGFFRAIDGGIARIIAWGEHQAALVVLRSFNDRQLRDIGLSRGQIGGLAVAAKDRSLMQNKDLPSNG